MIINAGMINSDTMQKSFDTRLFDQYTIPFDALKATKSFMIIDEPHKFTQNSKTWSNIIKIKPQFILRYGATFPNKEIEQKNPLGGRNIKVENKAYENLIYTLTAVESFNKNLVKGIITHITEFKGGENIIVRFKDSDGKEAIFEFIDHTTKKEYKLKTNDSLTIIHSAMTNLTIDHLNKSTVVLSNGLEMKKGDKINPYSYHTTLQENMIEKTIKRHFELEEELLTKEIRIKPLTLFFIDNIDEYRNANGSIRKIVESLIKNKIEMLLQQENIKNHLYYKSYLQESLKDISKTHGGYFSKDNTDKDENIEKEINEILHNKQALLDLDNPRRFIFSKWTLREGWDNPNVFQICKLRTSGSEISKLQEVGRGLRLPVNEYGNRVKDESFYLSYFVDFTESDFTHKLIAEINQTSDTISTNETYEDMSDKMIDQIFKCYNKENEEYDTFKNKLLEKLDNDNIITRTNSFKEGGFNYIKENYPLIFDGVHSNKIRDAKDIKKNIIIRTEKYQDLKDLWERINQKVILEYKFKDENEFKKLFIEFLIKQNNILKSDNHITEKHEIIYIENNQASTRESKSKMQVRSISTKKYSDFIKELSESIYINIKTIHEAIIESKIDINQYLNPSTIRNLKQGFNNFLMENAIDKFSIEYQKVSNNIHPTKLTNSKGEVLAEIDTSSIGHTTSNEKVASSYFLESLYYDSELEKQNIKTNINEIIVFTKIPKNSIKIPVAGGSSYSPDFAYVLKLKDGEQKLYFIVETKGVNTIEDLRNQEKYKIKHAEKFFNNQIKIQFQTQFKEDEIIKLINQLQV